MSSVLLVPLLCGWLCSSAIETRTLFSCSTKRTSRWLNTIRLKVAANKVRTRTINSWDLNMEVLFWGLLSFGGLQPVPQSKTLILIAIDFFFFFFYHQRINSSILSVRFSKKKRKKKLNELNSRLLISSFRYALMCCSKKLKHSSSYGPILPLTPLC